MSSANEQAGTNPPIAAKLSYAEQLSTSTVRVQAFGTDRSSSVGTGFHYFAKVGEGHLPLLITNKHVLEGSTSAIYTITKADEEHRPIYGDAIHVRHNDIRPYDHPDPEVDLCAVLIGGLIKHLQATHKCNLAFKAFEEDSLILEEDIQGIAALTSVLMVGYPIGLWDSQNNMPICRKGALATHLFLDYEGKKEFLVDIAAFGGSSGSPLVFDPATLRFEPEGVKLGPLKQGIIGVLHSRMTYPEKGVIRVQPVPTNAEPDVLTQQSINIGVCMRAVRIKELADHVAALYTQEKLLEGKPDPKKPNDLDVDGSFESP